MPAIPYIVPATGGFPWGAAPGRAFNVKNYGAKGDTRKVTDAVLTASSTTVTSATAAFTSADVGKVVYGIEVASGLVRLAVGTVTGVNSATSISVSVAAGSNFTGITLVLGTNDSDAIRSAVTAAKAANPVGVVYAPCGGYMFSKLLFDNRHVSLTNGISVLGDGIDKTVFFLHPSFDFSTTASNQGMLSAIVNCNNAFYEGFTLDGLGVTVSASGYFGAEFGGSGNSYVRNVYVTRITGSTCGVNIIGMNHGHIIGLKADFNTFRQVTLNQVSCAMFDCFISNGSNIGLFVYNCGSGDEGYGVRIFGGLIDEHGGQSVYITGSADVCFFGAKIWAGLGAKVVDVLASKVKFFGCELTPYNNHNNVTALAVDATSTAYLSAVRLVGTGSGKVVNNSGTVIDLGGNVYTGTFSGNTPLQLSSYRGIVVSPAQIAANKNDYDPGSLAEIIRPTSDASRNITGLRPLALTPTEGQSHVIVNVGAQDIVLTNEDAASTAAYRFHNTTGASITLSADQEAMLRYDSTTARWRVSKRN